MEEGGVGQSPHKERLSAGGSGSDGSGEPRVALGPASRVQGVNCGSDLGGRVALRPVSLFLSRKCRDQSLKNRDRGAAPRTALGNRVNLVTGRQRVGTSALSGLGF